jgi:hypothetical protein
MTDNGCTLTMRRVRVTIIAWKTPTIRSLFIVYVYLAVNNVSIQCCHGNETMGSFGTVGDL